MGSPAKDFLNGFPWWAIPFMGHHIVPDFRDFGVKEITPVGMQTWYCAREQLWAVKQKFVKL